MLNMLMWVLLLPVLLLLLASFSSKPLIYVHSLGGGTRRFPCHSCHYDKENNDIPNHYVASEQITDVLMSIVVIYKIVMGYQQTTLPLNEPSFKSQSYIEVNAGS